MIRAWHRGGGREGEDGGVLTWSGALRRHHGGTAAQPGHGSAKPWPSQAVAEARRLQRRHSEAHGLGIRSVGGDELATAHHGWRAEAMGTRRGSGETQIDAVDLNRHRVAVQMRHISPAAMAGIGRRKSAKAAATRESPELRGLGLARAREEGDGCVRPSRTCGSG